MAEEDGEDGAWFDIGEVNYFTYVYWAASMENYLKGQDLWEIVCGREVEVHADGVALWKWKRRSEAALDAIKDSVQEELAERCIGDAMRSPKEAWDALAAMFSNFNHSMQQGYKKENKPLNLNEPPMEDEPLCHVMLKKDNRPICLTQCLVPQSITLQKDDNPITSMQCLGSPPKVPQIWTISEIKPPENYSLSGLCKCFLHPVFENPHQRREWGSFLVFLQKNRRVAAVRVETCDFYILPPQKGADYSHVVVLYNIMVPFNEVNDQVPPLSDRVLLESHAPRNIVVPDSTKSTHEYVGPSIQPSTSSLNAETSESLGADCLSDCHTSRVSSLATHRLLEEFGDSTVNVECNNSLQRESNTRIEQNSPDVEHPQIAKKISSQASWYVAQQSRKMQYGCLQRNFIKADPTYLRTLSQSHSGWIFGAIAELVDNSKDAKATSLKISIETMYSKKAGEMIPVLSVVDDGHGMSHVDVLRMLSLGHKQPHFNNPHHIGRFGVGFKTGVMRLGEDALVLTQTTSSRSVALLSQSFNEGKDNIEIPIVSYSKWGNFMEVDTSFHSAEADLHLKAIKEFSPFNEYAIGQKLGLFDETGTGTQIYIWKLDKWGSDYSLDWFPTNTKGHSPCQTQGDILIRSRRIRSRPGQITNKVPLDYSLQAYLEVIFLEPRMKIYVQGSLVKCRPLAKSLNKTAKVNGDIMGIPVQLILGRSKIEYERVNSGLFLYWHGRLIEAYKRVGSMIHNADVGRGLIGVIDVTNVMNCGNVQTWVHSNKQGFQDCEQYAKLEEWLGDRADEYWDDNLNDLRSKKDISDYKTDHEWVQCEKCRKWRKLPKGFDSEKLPTEWFCFMPPFKNKCEIPEEQVQSGVVSVGAKRSRRNPDQNPVQHDEAAMMDSDVLAQAGEHQNACSSHDCFTTSLIAFPIESHQELHLTDFDPNGKLDAALNAPNGNEKSSKRNHRLVSSTNVHQYNLRRRDK